MAYDFEKLIKQDRDDHKQYKFEGTLLDYLTIVKENP
ncbi:MAG: PrkA domain protein, partial [Sporomusa sp.]|nr:PrkA domain protein [Sporomusa sp.]